MKISQLRAIYYSKQEKRYDELSRKIDLLNIHKEFNEFKNNYKGYYKNRVYSDFLRGVKNGK